MKILLATENIKDFWNLKTDMRLLSYPSLLYLYAGRKVQYSTGNLIILTDIYCWRSGHKGKKCHLLIIDQLFCRSPGRKIHQFAEMDFLFLAPCLWFQSVRDKGAWGGGVTEQKRFRAWNNVREEYHAFLLSCDLGPTPALLLASKGEQVLATQGVERLR